MMQSILGTIADYVPIPSIEASLRSFGRDRDFLEGVIAMAAWVAAASGGIEQAEKSKTIGFIDKHPMLKDFDRAAARRLFLEHEEAFAFDHATAADTAFKEIKEVQGVEKQRLVVQVGRAIGKCDGSFGHAEQEVVRTVCLYYGLDPNEFCR